MSALRLTAPTLGQREADALCVRMARRHYENFSVASLVFNRELGIVTSRPGVVGTLARLVASDAAGGEPWR